MGATVKLGSDKDGQRRNLIRKPDRIYEKNSNRKNIIRSHEVILPEVIESDEEYETDHEKGNPYDEDLKDEIKHDKGKGQRDTRVASQKVFRPPGKESLSKRKKEKRESKRE